MSMKQTVYTLFAVVCVFGTLIQASDIGSTENTQNEIVITPAHIKHLKKLAYILLEPRLHSKENAPMPDIEKIFTYIENLRSTDPELQTRRERGIDDILDKVKSFVKNILKKVDDLVDKI